MGEFWVVEGIDGAGKSHLLSRLADGSREVTVLRKDDLPKSKSPWADHRLSEMYRLTWGYDRTEPVWEHPAHYWLHTLAAWYELFHHAYVAPALSLGHPVIVDGWYFKHQARMLLSGDEHLISLATKVFSALPQPDQIAMLVTPPSLAATHRSGSSKPTEHGAFITGRATISAQAFTDYQARTARSLEELIRRHPATVHTLHSSAALEGLLSLIRRENTP